jgi:hypothetical protein
MKGQTSRVSGENMHRCQPPNSQTHIILVRDMAMIEYHSQNKVKELTLILSISAGVVLVCQNPSGTFLQVDCCVSRNDGDVECE